MPEPTATGRPATLARRIVAEGLGTAFLVTSVVGSGLMAERLAAGNVAITLLANSLATAGALVALILLFGPVSGAHFNPIVTLVLAVRRETPWPELPAYLAAQLVGAICGVAAAHLMFGVPLLSFTAHARSGPAQVFSEFVATFGLLGMILGCIRHRIEAIPYAVACYIAAAYWFTASTSFANPAVTIARALTDSFAGIRPEDVPPFIGAQLAGAVAAAFVFGWLLPRRVSDRSES